MIALGIGLLAGWVVVRLRGADRRFPWRVAELGEGAASTGRRSLLRPWPGGRSSDARGAGTSAVRDGVRRRRIEADLPATVDLLVVAVTAGHSLHTAVAAVGRLGTGPVAESLAGVSHRFDRGSSLQEGLESLPQLLGDPVRPLVTTLVASSGSGAPLGPALQRLADSERRRRRRRAETRVRRLPVLLLAPLVALVLPAFVLLTIVPVVLTTARTGVLPVLGLMGPLIPTIHWSPT